jgi:hypothetical protein
MTEWLKLVEYLPSRHEVLCSNPNTAKREEEKKNPPYVILCSNIFFFK